MDCSWLKSGPITIGAFDRTPWLGKQGELRMETRISCLRFCGLPSRIGIAMDSAALYTFERRKPIKNVVISP